MDNEIRKDMKVIFFSYIDCLCLISHFLSFRKYDEIYYFDISIPAKILTKYLKLNKRIKYFKFNLSELLDETGESIIERIFRQDIANSCDKIRNEVFENTPFINAFARIFEREKSILFFRKIVGLELQHIIIFMNVIKCYRRSHFRNKSVIIKFSIEKNPYFHSLKEFAYMEYNLLLIPNFCLTSKIRILCLSIRNSITLFKAFFMSIINTLVYGKSSMKKSSIAPKVGRAYGYCGITFDLMHRCDFPWLLMSDIPFQQVLIYFVHHPMYAPTKQDFVNLKTRTDINYIATCKKAAVSEDIPIYKPTWKVAEQIFNRVKKLFPDILRELLSLRLYYIAKAIRFIDNYSRAYDFYFTNNIKININDLFESSPYLIAEKIALRDTGGVNIGCQTSNLNGPNVSFSSCTDILFLYGPYYYPIIEKSGSDNDNIVFCGFLPDYSFKKVRQRSDKMREMLMSNGAKLIVCYFDEGSSDDRMSVSSNKQSEFIYRKLLDWVISDNEIGLICSPKKPLTLARRIAGVARLIEKAKTTGRCLFIEGNIRTYNWPSETAQASDVVIGSLVGGSTVLEGLLSGVRSVYLDWQRAYSYPEYRYGRNKIVFDDIDNLISAINRYRYDKKNFSDFGSISLVSDLINRKDIFRDGKAARRMGRYIKRLLDGFNEKKSREEAINYANQNYIEQWGKQSLIKCERK